MKMRHLGCLIFSLSSIYSGALMADSKLWLQDGVSVLASNGKELVSGEVADGQLSIEPGTNQLLVRYSVELATSDGDLEKSDTFVLLFEAAEGQELWLNAPVIKRSRDLKAFNRNGSWQLSDPSGKEIAFKKAVIKKEGFQLGRDYERELEQFNKTDSPAAYIFNRPVVKLAAVSAPETTVPVPQAMTSSGKDTTSALMAERMLKYWYNQADYKTRERFKSWVSQ